MGGKGSYIGGISTHFGGPGQKDLGAGKMLQVAVCCCFCFLWMVGNFEKIFAGG